MRSMHSRITTGRIIFDFSFVDQLYAKNKDDPNSILYFKGNRVRISLIFISIIIYHKILSKKKIENKGKMIAKIKNTLVFF